MQQIEILNKETGEVEKIDWTGDIYKALAGVKKDLGGVDKSQKASGFGAGYNFRGIDDIYNALHKPFADHGIICTTKILKTEETQITSNKGTKGTRVVRKYLFRFYTTDGSYVETESTGEAMDFGDKAYNKCHSIAHKYAILTVLCIPTKDIEDPDKTIHEPINAESAPAKSNSKKTTKKKTTTTKASKPERKNHAPQAEDKSADQKKELINLTRKLAKHNGYDDELVKELMKAKFGHNDSKLLGIKDCQILFDYTKEVIEANEYTEED